MNLYFSIIIPTFNEEKFIPKLLTDLSNQTFKNFEVIIVDRLSQDKTKKVIDQYKSKLKLIFFFTNIKNVAGQRNFGAKKAQGQYLIFLDADVRISKGFLKKVNQYINKNKGLVFIPFIAPEKKYKKYQPFFDLVNLIVEFTQKLPKKFSLGGSIIIEKNLFSLIGGFDESLFISEDHELIQRVSKWGVITKFIKSGKVCFSLRRMEKEGEIKFLSKYFFAFIRRFISKKEIREKIFEYQMGGHLYNNNLENKKNDFFNDYLNRVKKLLKDFKKTIRKI